jgi:hypothetical protein
MSFADDDIRDDEHSVIESAQLLSPVFERETDYADLKSPAKSSALRALIARADERLERA